MLTFIPKLEFDILYKHKSRDTMFLCLTCWPHLHFLTDICSSKIWDLKRKCKIGPGPSLPSFTHLSNPHLCLPDHWDQIDFHSSHYVGLLDPGGLDISPLLLAFYHWIAWDYQGVCEGQRGGHNRGCFPICLLGPWQEWGALWAPTLGKYIWVLPFGATRQVGKDGVRETWPNGLPYPAFTYLSFFFLLWPRACLLITVQNITMSKALTCFNPHKISCDGHLPHQNFVGSCQDTGCLIGKSWTCTPKYPQPHGIHPLHWPCFMI